MSNKIQITKENSLNLSVGQLLTFVSFYDDSNNGLWNSINGYIYKNQNGNVKFIEYSEIYPPLKDCFRNVIFLSNTKLGFEGEHYWKVFHSDEEAKFHKCENNGKDIAILFKPYKDKIHSNTNSNYPRGINRFKTLLEAEEYCNKVKKQ